MLTQEEINAIRDGLATKEDLKNFVTKDDLEGLASKSDLSKLEKKVDLRFKQMDVRFDVIEEKIDGVLKFAETIEEERDANEKRLSKIEATIGI